MSHPPANRGELLAVFSRVAAQFTAASQTVDECERRIKPLLSALSIAQKSDPWASSALSEDHDFLQLVKDCTYTLREQLEQQMAQVLSYQKKNNFRQRFNDSLLIYVYGKVKAGKSSLGNFIAWGRSQPDDAIKALVSPIPQFFVEADSGVSEAMTPDRMARQQHFTVGVTETTNSVQGFTLPGLTWVDSPGVHSVTAVNGALAQEYADAADLILYLSNSSSPGRKSDLDEICRLIDKNKPIMVLIPASDTFDEDVDDEGNLVATLVMKPDSDRSEQERYVANELASRVDIASSGVSIQTISVDYAWHGAEAECNERWQESGLGTFAATIASVAQSGAVHMKQRTPLVNHKNFCDDLQTNSQGLLDILAGLEEQLKHACQQLNWRSGQIHAELDQRLQPRIDKMAEQYAMDDRLYLQHCSQVWEQEFAASVAALLDGVKDEFDQMAGCINALVATDRAIPGFKKRVERIAFNSSLGEKVGKASGAALGAAIGGIAGSIVPGVGTLVGSGLGGLVGGLFGGYGGGKVGEHFNKTEYEELELGDNRDEVALQTRQVLSARGKRELEALTLQLEKACYGDVQQWLSNIRQVLVCLQQELNEQIHTLSKELKQHELA
ncbi:dynamin family protein [Pectobacterium versatile]|uniref:Dynamin family protein n=1 Tax=Pectobacterium versatile TaxID=2488639 RepID=A0ABU8K5S0_9GAMM|nr:MULTISPECIES: dynamin family protein [Pectobacterium]MBN3196694.1 dynamin family protein [Pectobacterium versatile]TAI92959.1 dGTPase [Pectobacterium versatile]UCP83152.1 dynamin family protein [Pectobacterium versatile]ULS47311.1 dGTPase [Pectobacterium carotovorum]